MKSPAECLMEWNDLTREFLFTQIQRVEKENNLSMPQMRTLLHIRNHQINGVCDIGCHMQISSAAASQLLDRLVQQELIVRTEDPADRRVKKLGLAPRGEQIFQQFEQYAKARFEELINTLSKEEQTQTCIILTKLIENAHKLNASSFFPK